MFFVWRAATHSSIFLTVRPGRRDQATEQTNHICMHARLIFAKIKRIRRNTYFSRLIFTSPAKSVDSSTKKSIGFSLPVNVKRVNPRRLHTTTHNPYVNKYQLLRTKYTKLDFLPSIWKPFFSNSTFQWEFQSFLSILVYHPLSFLPFLTTFLMLSPSCSSSSSAIPSSCSFLLACRAA